VKETIEEYRKRGGRIKKLKPFPYRRTKNADPGQIGELADMVLPLHRIITWDFPETEDQRKEI
jgi:hypothetical protein